MCSASRSSVRIARFYEDISLLLCSSTCTRLYPQRPSGHAVSTDVFPSLRVHYSIELMEPVALTMHALEDQYV